MDWFDFSLKLPITDPTWIFLLVLLIILFAPILLNKLRIPHIIGMILAGLVSGEHGFNILVRDSSFELFGKVGLYYIMFLAGLEMNMGDFKQNRGKALVLGLLAFIVPIGIGLVTNIALLKYGVLTSVLLASMYASHTLVAYPIVIRYGVSRHRSEYCSGRNGGYGYTHFAGSGRCGWYVQGGVGRLLLGMACHKGYLPGYFDCISVSTHRPLVLPEVR